MAGESARQDGLYLERIERIQHILSAAQDAPVPRGRETVQIGHLITLTYALWENNTSRRVREMYEIVGFEEGDCNTTPMRLCYQADLAKHFLGEQKGHKVLVRIAGQARMVTLTNIKRAKQ
ncbi:hypothetical protein KJ819_02030 [Patescibacteria group bacterium]|nr:hypothetical protein [Patescibacteria group bacterium]MBU1500937.1 hypothetical protein [Patescibacteria group bacterium]MBU2080568.1 hypothetical protein [Patescibacteria group bacterium]MBU2124356.1 hypothetical protein [Patescibacteria group bacterium]MBU2194483.1 hypothetical protein [Patescibacteria group bacterium]